MRSLFTIVAGFVALTTGTGAGAQTPTVTDPQAYCRTAGTVDMPDRQFTPDKTPEWMVAPFVNPQYPRAIYGISWRCVSGNVLVCQNAQSPSCLKANTDRTPTPGMRDFCRSNSNSPVIPRVVMGTERMLAYDWICRGSEPAIAKETRLDAQGFVAADWKRVSPK
ncbi:MAG: hypothetical protein EPO55_09380 [Reyranella sp.]|uniref:hypothetical protein n=1 Tax=Reyranella sp. TaxID=1929291 RepID=UPI001204554D|nr:hypothetical protein [Reyranella sp.]TAJ40366.1 MAG: hypothetical protein EPO55_09380 [Reyranella sp.]